MAKDPEEEVGTEVPVEEGKEKKKEKEENSEMDVVPMTTTDGSNGLAEEQETMDLGSDAATAAATTATANSDNDAAKDSKETETMGVDSGDIEMKDGEPSDDDSFGDEDHISMKIGEPDKGPDEDKPAAVADAPKIRLRPMMETLLNSLKTRIDFERTVPIFCSLLDSFDSFDIKPEDKKFLLQSVIPSAERAVLDGPIDMNKQIMQFTIHFLSHTKTLLFNIAVKGDEVSVDDKALCLTYLNTIMTIVDSDMSKRILFASDFRDVFKGIVDQNNYIMFLDNPIGLQDTMNHFLLFVILAFRLDEVFDMMATSHILCSFQHYRLLLSILHGCTKCFFLNISTGKRHLSSVMAEIAIKWLGMMTNDDVKSFVKDQMDKTFQLLQFCIEHPSTLDTVEALDKLFLSVALRCIQSDYIDKRVYGVRCLGTATNWAKYTEYRHDHFITQPFYLEWLSENSVVERIFDTSAQVEVIKESRDIVEFVLSQSDCPISLLTLIWNSVMTLHESISVAILQVIEKCSFFISDSVATFFVSSVEESPIEKLNPAMISFYQKIFDHKRLYDRGMEFFVNLVIRKHVSGKIRPIIEKSIMDVLKYVDNQLLRAKWTTFFIRCLINHMTGVDDNEDDVFFSLIILKSLIEPSYYNYANPEKVKSIVLSSHQLDDGRKLRLVDIVLNEVINSHSKMNKISSSMSDSDLEDSSKSGVKDGFIVRLEFLAWLLTKSQVTLAPEHFAMIWGGLCSNFIPSHTEAFLEFDIECSKGNPVVVFPADCINMIADMVGLAEQGLISRNCFTKIWRLACSVDHVVDPSKAVLDSLACFNSILNIMLSCPDSSVFEEGKRCVFSLCPFTPNDRKSKYILPRDEALMTIFVNLALSESSALLSGGEKEMSDEAKDNQLSARKMARVLELIDSFITIRNDNGYNCFVIDETMNSKQGLPITVSVNMRGVPLMKIKTVSSETLRGFCALVSDKLKPFCPMLDLSKMAFFFDGTFIPQNEWSEAEYSRTLKDAGIRNGAELRVLAPDDVSERAVKLIVRTGSTGGLDCDSEVNKEEHSDNAKPSSEEISRLVEELCKDTGIDQDFSLFLLSKVAWNAEDAREILGNPDRLPEFQRSYDKEKKEREASSAAAHSAQKVLLPSLLAKSISSLAPFTSTIFSLLKCSNESVARAAWSLLQHIPLRRDGLDKLGSDCLDECQFSLSTPYTLLYYLHMVEFILCSTNESVLADRLFKNGVTSFIVGKLFPQLVSSLSSSLKESLAVCISIVTIVSNDSRSSDVKASLSLQQTISVLGFIGEHSSSLSESDAVIVCHVFELLYSAARSSAEKYQLILDNLFAVPDGKEFSVVHMLLLQHNDRRVRQETAGGIMLLLLSDEDPKLYASHIILCINKLIPFISDGSLVGPEYSSHSEQFFNLVAFLCNELISLSSAAHEDPEIVFAPMKELFESNFPLWLDIMFETPVVEVFIKSKDSSDEKDSLLAGMMSLLRKTIALFPSLKGSLFGPPEVKRVLDDILFKVTNTLQPQPLPKAKLESTRAAGMDLLSEAIKDCPENAAVVAEYMSGEVPAWMDEHIEGSQNNKSWSFNPLLYSRGSLGFVGLHNSGNLCYLNSVMQQLYHISKLRRAILAVDVNSLTCSNELRTFVFEFQKLFYSMSHSEEREVNPRKFLSTFAKLNDYFEETQQHDADEFLNILWQRLEDALKDSPQWKSINTVFSGTIQHEIKSMDESKPYVQHRYEDFHVLSLEIASKNSLSDTLEFFIQPDKLSGENAYFCEKYKCKIDASKHAMLQHLPPVLAVHLKRFAYNPGQGKMVKLHNKLEFPKSISLEPYTVEDELDRNPSRFKYKLRGVIVHSGECQSGHYYSFINITSPFVVDPATGKHVKRWHKFNDGDVELYPEDQLEQQWFGGKKIDTVYNPTYRTSYEKEVPITNSAYMLFYERSDMIDDDDDYGNDGVIADDSVVGDPAVEPVAAATAAASTAASDAPRTTFANLPSVMNAENMKYIHRRFLNSPTFFSLVNYLWMQKQEPCDPRTLVRMFLEVICRSFAKERFVSAWANHISALFEKDKELSAWYLEYVVSNGLIKSHVLPSSPTELVRVKVTDTIVAAMKSAMSLEEDLWGRYDELSRCDVSTRRASFGKPTPLFNLLENLISLLRPCREFWQTFNQYFHLFLEFAKLGPQARLLMMKANIAYLFSFFFQSKNHNVAVYNANNFPDLRDFYYTLQHIWCGCYQGPNDDSSSPYACDTTLVKSTAAFKKELFEDSFFAISMEHPYNPKALARIACHWCYNDIQASKRMMDYCQRTMSLSSEARKCARFVICSVLDISDSLQDARINLAMTCVENNRATGILGMLQSAQSHSTESLLRNMELLDHCCNNQFGFALALQSRGMLDWLDGYCVYALKEDFKKQPKVFERLCLDEVVDKEYADRNSVKCFLLMRSLMRRMDSVDASELARYRSLVFERRTHLLEEAITAVQNNQPYIEQSEWDVASSLVKCGRCTAPEEPNSNYAYAIVGLPSVPSQNQYSSMSDNEISNNKTSNNHSHTPSEDEIKGMIAQAAEVFGAVDETQFRSLLKQYNYDIEQAIGAMLG